jgi:hypothetical protein
VSVVSYDYGREPFATPGLLKEFTTLLSPEVPYILELSMDATGLSTFSLLDSSGQLLEVQTVQHDNLCPDNYNEGFLQGLYFGGTCRAPVDVTVQYS